MNRSEIERIEGLAASHGGLRALWARHRSLEAELARLDAQRFLTPAEQLRRKELQKRKLAGRDRIQRILRQYDESGVAGAPSWTPANDRGGAP